MSHKGEELLGYVCVSWPPGNNQPYLALVLKQNIELDMHTLLFKPPQLFCDNMSALHMSINHVFHAKTKYIELDYHFEHEKVALGSLITRCVLSQDQLTDIFTKPLSNVLFRSSRGKLGIRFLPTSILKKNEENQQIKSFNEPIVIIPTASINHRDCD